MKIAMRETHHSNGLSIWNRCLDYLRQKKLIPEKSPKVVFVPTDRIDRHRELADDFVINVLEKDWAYISNESSLLDFHADMSDPTDLLERIRERYSLDVSDVPNFNIADILDRIAAEREKKC
jgi:hypothetical protein